MTNFRFAALLVCLPLVACGPSKEQGGDASKPAAENASATTGARSRGARSQTVSSTLTKLETIPSILETQGNVISLDEVDIRPQKTGTISKIHIKEGEEVKKGQRLFSLDSREDEANLKKAEARVIGSRAQRDIAERNYQRAQDLANKNYISAASLDTSKSALENAEATLAQDLASLESAKVVLSYDHIAAPFDGRAGRIDVRPGSLVLANSTTSLVKISRLDPIGVSFTLPERQLPMILAAQKEGDVKVRVELSNNKTLRGKLIFIENSVDRVSGTISMKARLSNEERLLWPGQFTPVKVLAGETKDAVTLPAQAIQSNTEGRFVYVIKDDQTVYPKPVELIDIYQQRAIIKGIEDGVKVVLEGGQNLKPGSKVTEAAAASAPANGKRRKGGRRGSGASSAQERS